MAAVEELLLQWPPFLHSCVDEGLDLPQVYFVNGKNWWKKLGNGKFGKGKAFNVSGRLITDDEIDLGQTWF